MMTLWVRNWPCGCCGGPVYFDDERGVIICKCAVIHVDLPMPTKAKTNYREANIKDMAQAVKMGEITEFKHDGEPAIFRMAHGCLCLAKLPAHSILCMRA